MTPNPLQRSAAGQSLPSDLNGSIVLVTGATSGIGRAVALTLAEAGASVAVHGRNPDAAAAVANELAARQGGHAGTVLADLTTTLGVGEVLEFVKQQIPELLAVVHVAGADVLTGAGASLDFEEKLAVLLAVDVRATMLLSRAVGRWMAERSGGAIVTIGWDQAEHGMAGDSGELFAATKGAVMAFTKSLAKSLAPRVRVNCVAPGWIRTAWGAGASDTWQRRAVNESLLARWGTPEDIAGAIHWLLSPRAAFVTGQVINVNGGFRGSQT